MSRIRSDLWCTAFVRRMNDRGTLAVQVRRGDPVAGPIWIEYDHLDGTATLLSPAPLLSLTNEADSADVVFQTLVDRAPINSVADRLRREADIDPDFWHIAVESRVIDDELKLNR